jgi:TetR/AcrR family transcriptional regulator, mexJK operon transcriptional repressor
VRGAQRLFLDKGFAATSTDAIAAEAGVSKQTLYVYYPSKEELLADVLEHLIEDGLRGGPSLTVEEESPGSRDELWRALDSLARRLISGLMDRDYVALVRVVIAETRRLPHLGRLFRTAVPERVLRTVSALLEAARENGVIGTVDSDAASRAFVGPLLTYVLLDGLFVGDGPPRPPGPERIEAAVHLFMKSVA